MQLLTWGLPMTGQKTLLHGVYEGPIHEVFLDGPCLPVPGRAEEKASQSAWLGGSQLLLAT